MKTKILFLALSIIVVFASCRSTKKTVKTDIKSSVTANVKTKISNQAKIDIRLKTDSSKFVIDKGQVSEVVAEESITTVFSNPDTRGEQHIISVTSTKRGVRRNENKNIQENKQNSKLFTDNSDYKSDLSVKDKIKKKNRNKLQQDDISKTPTPGWVYVLILAVIAVVFILCFLLLKRYKII